MSAMQRQARLIEPFVRPFTLGLFGFYIVWNVLWIASGRVPDSILKGLTGLPCPTTGCTRSVVALMHGEWLQAFFWNPFTLVFATLAVWSGARLSAQFLRRERLALTPFMARLWMFALAAGWIAKFALGSTYW